MRRTLSVLMLIIAVGVSLFIIVKKSALNVSTPIDLSLENPKLETGYENHNADTLTNHNSTGNVEQVVNSLSTAEIDLLNQVALSESLNYRVQKDTLYPNYSQPFNLVEIDSLPESPNIFAGADIPFTVAFDKKIYSTNDVALVTLSGPAPLQVLVNQRLISHQRPPTSLQMQLSDYELPIIITVIDSVNSKEFRLELNVLSVIQVGLHIDPYPIYEHNHMAINYRLTSSEVGYFMIRALLQRDGIPVAILTSEQYLPEYERSADNRFKIDAALLKDLDMGEHTWSLDNIFIERLGSPLEEDKISLVEKRVELFGVESSALTIDKELRMEREEARIELIKPLLSE